MSEENPADADVEVEEEPAKEAEEPAPDTIARLTRLNQQLGLLLSLSAKLVVVLGVVMAAYLILSQIFRAETYSIGKLDVPGQLQSQGYTSELVARHVASDLRSIVDNAQVPDKLMMMFISDDMDEEERKRIEESIGKEYAERKEELNISLSFGIFDLPIDQFLVHLRGWLGIDSTTVESSITIQATSLSMTVGLVTNGETKELATFVEHFDTEHPDAMYMALDRLIELTARYILETNHPIVMVLQDFEIHEDWIETGHRTQYSAKDKFWTGSYFTNEKRIQILKARIENPPDDSQEILKWAHAVLGHIMDEAGRDDEALHHYEAALVVDREFVGMVGHKMVNKYLYRNSEATWQDCGSAALVTDELLRLTPPNTKAIGWKLEALDCQRGLISPQTSQADIEALVADYRSLLARAEINDDEKLGVHLALIDIHAGPLGSETAFYSTLKSALDTGVSPEEFDMESQPLCGYAVTPDFQTLLNSHPKKMESAEYEFPQQCD